MTKTKPAFTIVELLIVIVVIAILTAITIVAFNGIQERARASEVSSALSQAKKKIGVWQVDNPESTPPSLAAAEVTNSGNVSYQYKPGSNGVYCITATSGNTSYKITNTTSPEKGGCPGHGQGTNTAITNLVTNPSFESNTSGWLTSTQCGSPTIDNTIKYSGNNAYRCTANTTSGIAYFNGPLTAVNPGETYTVSTYIRASTARSVEVYISASDANGNEIQRVNSNYTSIAANTWARASASGVIPTGATAMRIQVNYRNTPLNEQSWVDGVMYTSGSTIYNYTDGNSTDWIWNGTANNSTSTGPAL